MSDYNAVSFSWTVFSLEWKFTSRFSAVVLSINSMHWFNSENLVSKGDPQTKYSVKQKVGSG